jgi:hypothetical protein
MSIAGDFGRALHKFATSGPFAPTVLRLPPSVAAALAEEAERAGTSEEVVVERLLLDNAVTREGAKAEAAK